MRRLMGINSRYGHFKPGYELGMTSYSLTQHLCRSSNSWLHNLFYHLSYVEQFSVFLKMYKLQTNRYLLRAKKTYFFMVIIEVRIHG